MTLENKLLGLFCIILVLPLVFELGLYLFSLFVLFFKPLLIESNEYQIEKDEDLL